MPSRTEGTAPASAYQDCLFVGQSELASRMRELDWAATPLGPSSGWPQSLKTAIGIMLASRQPIWIGWGKDLTYLYNDAYKSIIGGRHPWALGQPASVVWREIWDDIAPLLTKALSGEEGTYTEAQLLIMERNGYPEETHYTYSFSPIPDENGKPGGIFCTNTDDTQRVIGERQLAMLRELAAATTDARSWQEACSLSARALETDLHDLPFAMIYALQPKEGKAVLTGLSGMAHGHPAAAAVLDVTDQSTWPIAMALRTHRPQIVSDLTCIADLPFPGGAWSIAPAKAVVIPIPASGGDDEHPGVLIAGLNPFRLFDERYASFLKLAAGQIGAAIVHADAYEQERHRAETLADALEQKVLERTRELIAANTRLIEEAEQRRTAESQFQHLVEGVVDYALFMLNPQGIITNWNTGAERIKGYAASEIIGQHFRRFYSEEDRAAGVPDRALETARREGKFEAEGWRYRKDGSRFWASVVINPIRDRDGTLLGFAKITRDITERREAQLALMRAQEQLAQAQKMEGIGQLTGGIAHDFNNLLTIIIGNLEVLQRHFSSEKTDPARQQRAVDLAMRGARRAEALTQRLLAFSRQQPLDPRPVELGRLVSGMSDLLRRTIGEQIAVETVLTGGIWRTFVDPNQLEVAVINLAVNARDAMPRGGKLTLETANVYLDERYTVDHAEVTPGQYVMLAVSDTGLGMTREVLTRAFEPFFTTKDVGHGTGLGLSQVYGFVKQSGGHIKIYSEVGVGTTVKIYLPRLFSSEAIEAEPAPLPVVGSGGETILVVEDDDDVRAFSTDTLRELGYRVLEASTGSAAFRLLDQHPEIQALFTDIGLPGGMNGRKLSEAARAKRPDLKVLFATGYARNAIVHDGRLDPGIELVTKPFTQADVAARLRDILDARSQPTRILVVEDEVLLQMLATDMLEEFGFKVDTAGSATEALKKLRLIPGGVDAAIIDIGLPDRSGDMLLPELRALYPELPVVFATGHDRTAIEARFKDPVHVAFVGKPYLATDLLQALQSVGIRHGRSDLSAKR